MRINKLSALESVFLVLFIFLCFASTSEAAVLAVRNIAITLLDMDNVTEYGIKTALVFTGYLFQYLALSGLFEYTNPAPKTEKRMNEVRAELKIGIFITFINVFFATTWMFLVEPHTQYFAYYSTHPFTLRAFVEGFIVYFLFADTWFYWTHRLLHLKWFWRNVHYLHHSFVYPTAFAQDAVHWFEAIIQGPCGHFGAALLYPMHPVFMAVAGFMTALYAIAAHDGRAFDLNSHTRHHTHKMGASKWGISGCNFALYWGLWDFICGTRYDPKKASKWTPTKDLYDAEAEKTKSK